MIRKAVILAAGRGTRMGDYTIDTPKAMLPVRGRPMLEHVLDGLASVGIEQFLVVTGYRREMVEEYFGQWRLPVEFRVQETLDGTGSATPSGSRVCRERPVPADLRRHPLPARRLHALREYPDGPPSDPGRDGREGRRRPLARGRRLCGRRRSHAGRGETAPGHVHDSLEQRWSVLHESPRLPLSGPSGEVTARRV
ncbi:MAG: NTP transferase domain-containing protein [Paludibaculum sp.]